MVVPETKQSLYHPVSKAVLEPGTEAPKPSEDISWLIQKHQEAINDFGDVDPQEKEFVIEWDAFIIHKRISSDAFLPRAWLSFVKEKASWLVASPLRMIEFGKHLSYLMARDALDDQTVQRGFGYIRTARMNRQDRGEDVEVAPKLSPKASLPRKSAGGCTVCGLPVLGQRLLICARMVSFQS